jgi:ribosomal protein S18 acetylase RimI-like enzyme
MYLEKVQQTDIGDFHRIVEAYWHEVMPQSDVVKNPERREAYFRECFTWAGGNRQPYWAIADGRRVGFVTYTVDAAKHSASIDDFYVMPDARRRGYGTAMVQAVYAQLDTHGVALVELNVRSVNPHAFAFWEAQGFRIALYRMRQYRDPKTGKSYIGALSSDFA